MRDYCELFQGKKNNQRRGQGVHFEGGHVICYFQKKPNWGEWGLTMYLIETPPGIIRFTPRDSRQNKVSPLETSQNCVVNTHLQNLKGRKPRPLWKFHMTFSWSLLEIPRSVSSIQYLNLPIFLINLWKFHLLFLQYLPTPALLEIPYHQPCCIFGFFLE